MAVNRPCAVGSIVSVASAVAFALALVSPATAASGDDAIANAEGVINHHRTSSTAHIQSLLKQTQKSERSAAQRLADGELSRRARNFDQAAATFNQIVHKYSKDSQVYAEALFLLGETYYESKQLLSAKRIFSRIVQESSTPRVAAYRSKALARLTDVALKSGSLEDIDALYSRIHDSSRDPVLAYARTRILIAKGELDAALAAQRSIPNTSPLFHQAKYLEGVIALKRAQAALQALPAEEQAKKRTRASSYAQAIQAFRDVTTLAQDSDEHVHVVQLGWLALGRLYYETEQWRAAIDAYAHVPRQSVEYNNALFELASVYVEMGDVHRAQRALEVLAVIDPQGAQAAEAGLLRGEMELRAGLFSNALATFEGVHAQFEPMYDRVNNFLNSTSDPAVYYDRLVDDQVAGIDASNALPPVTIAWAREAPDGKEAFAVVDEVVLTRNILRQTERLAIRLQAIMESSGRAKAFPQLHAAQQATTSAINDLMRARLILAKALTSEQPSELSGQIASVRSKRRSLERKVADLPVTPADFQKRETSTSDKWNRAGQQILQLQLQIDTLQALVNALNRMVKEGPSQGIVRDETSTALLHNQLVEQQQELTTLSARITTLRESVDEGRTAAAFATPSTVGDDNVRALYKQTLNQEMQLASQGAAGPGAASFAKRAIPVLRSADNVDRSLEVMLSDIQRQVDKGTDGLLQELAAEKAKIADYTTQLESLDQLARIVVGDVALRNFQLVRDRLRGIVIRADVGVTEQAWEAREIQQLRVRSLQAERAKSERLLQEELREVLDDANEK